MYLCRIILVSLLFSVGSGYECPGPASVAISVKNSTAVFSAEVISEEYRNVKEGSMGEPREAKALVIKLKVKRWWKGNGAEEVDLYTSVRKYPDGTQSFMEEDFRFRKGENYLVYAYGPEERLRTDGCKRTRRLADAEEDLLELGEAKKTQPEAQVTGTWEARFSGKVQGKGTSQDDTLVMELTQDGPIVKGTLRFIGLETSFSIAGKVKGKTFSYSATASIGPNCEATVVAETTVDDVARRFEGSQTQSNCEGTAVGRVAAVRQ